MTLQAPSVFAGRRMRFRKTGPLPRFPRPRQARRRSHFGGDRNGESSIMALACTLRRRAAFVLFVTAIPILACNASLQPPPPRHVPRAVFSTICTICTRLRAGDPRPGAGIKVVVVRQTQPIYYLEEMATKTRRHEAKLLEARFRREWKSTELAAGSLPETSCHWFLVDLERLKNGNVRSDAPGTFWVMMSSPMVNPFVDGRTEVGVFVRIAWTRSSLLGFPGQRWWVGLRRQKKRWSALPPRAIHVIEM